ncbi:Arc family DNA-binding protein [Parasedimentitalea marina]|uniref:Arc family DNA-binding protein n=1 Tax=Parasedimentitalea marina TaxID=2483033 RepID=A0A3T0N7D0_9RHOB|nr:Arc family DNA-binding protein [Parasedimentitalea marina]AZV79889.1 Arc family DNA-binding protein [Parasedimentitalea marina]
MSAKSEFPSDKQDKYVLRFPDGMRDRIKAAAAENNRSMNAEIVATLEENYPSIPSLEELMKILEDLSGQLGKMEQGPEWAEASNNFIELIDAIRGRIHTFTDDEVHQTYKTITRTDD